MRHMRPTVTDTVFKTQWRTPRNTDNCSLFVQKDVAIIGDSS